MKLKFSLGCLAVVVLVLGFIAPATETLGQNSKRTRESEADNTAWVKEIEPGIRLYGHVPEYGEVGESHQFDVSPDGQTIVFAVSTEIKFWNIERKQVEHRIDLKTPATIFEYSPDGLKLLIVTGGFSKAVDDRSGQVAPSPANFVSVWDAITHEKILEIESSAGKDAMYGPSIRQLAVSPDGELIAIGYGTKTQIHNVQSGDKLCDITHKQFAQFIAFMPDGEQIVDSWGNRFDVETGEEIGKLPNRFSGRFMNSLKVHPRRNVIAAVSWDQGIIAYDLEKEEQIKLEEPKGNLKRLFAVEFSNNGRFVAAATYGYQDSTGAQLFIWDFDSGKLLNRIALASAHLNRMRFSADNKDLFTKCHGEWGISEWKVEADQSGKSETLMGNKSPISGFQFSANRKTILAASSQGNSVVYDVESGEPLDNIYSLQTSYLDMTSDGEYVLLGAFNNSAAIYDCEEKKSTVVNILSFSPPSPVRRLAGLLTGRSSQQYESFAINNAIVADDDEHFLVAMRSQQHFRWEKYELKSGKSAAQKRFRMNEFWDVDDNPQNHYWKERTTAIAPNGQWLAIVNHNNDVFVIDAESGVLLHQLEDAGGSPCKIHFTPDSSTMMVVAENLIRVWDVESGEETDSAMKMKSPITGIAISRNGDRLAALSSTKPATMKVFDLENHAEVYSRKLKGGYNAIGISEDGRHVALAKNNCQFELLDIAELAGR